LNFNFELKPPRVGNPSWAVC